MEELSEVRSERQISRNLLTMTDKDLGCYSVSQYKSLEVLKQEHDTTEAVASVATLAL